MLDAPPLGCGEQARPAMLDCGQRLGRAEAQESILSGHGYSFIPSYLHLPCSSLAGPISPPAHFFWKSNHLAEKYLPLCLGEWLSGWREQDLMSSPGLLLIPAHSACLGELACRWPAPVLMQGRCWSPRPSPPALGHRERKKKKEL